MQRFIACLLGLTGLLLLGSCGGEGGGTKPPTGSSTSGSLSVSYKLSDGAKIVTRDSGATLVSETADEIVFGGKLPDIKVGDSFVSQLGNGALKKALAVTNAGATLKVKAGATTLLHVVESADASMASLTKEDFGDLVSPDPNVAFEWVSSAPGIPARPSSGREVSFDILKITFNKATISTGASISGTSYVQMNPDFQLKINRRAGDLLPSVEAFSAGARPIVTGTLTVSRTYSGSVNANKDWVDMMGKPIVAGYLVLIPRLKVSSSLSGIASGALSATKTWDYRANAVAKYLRGTGWQSENGVVHSLSGDFSGVNAGFTIEAVPINVELSFLAYALVGPQIDLQLKGSLLGQFQANSAGEEGINAELSVGVSAGLAALDSGYLDKLGLDAELGRVNADVVKKKIWEEFFPFTGPGAIRVADNGPAADDVFEVSVNGTVLGRTTKGGSGQFRVENLLPGTATLTLKAVDAGQPGDIATYGITLSSGVTFPDGSTSRSGDMYLDETATYTIIVPEPGKAPAFSTHPEMPRSTKKEKTLF